jgi:nucleotide-binding universal stress UspA family protein
MSVEKPKRILCPVDFSNYSAAALVTAGNLAKSAGASLTVLHAQAMDAPVYFTAAQEKALKGQLRKSRQAGEKQLAEFAGEHVPKDVDRTIVVVEDDPAQAILREFKRSGVDWVVMGTHGRTGLTKIRLGSVMESVLGQLDAPLVTVGPRVKMKATLGALRRILVAVDFTDASVNALEQASALAALTGSELDVAHVVEMPREAEHLEPDRHRLCDWIEPSLRERCSIHEIVRQGNPAEQIVAAAESSRADLIVLAAEPRNFLGSLFFGSTVERVIRHAPAPVLVIT